jgi:hypothetical protein
MRLKVVPLESWMCWEWARADCLESGRYQPVTSRFNQINRTRTCGFCLRAISTHVPLATLIEGTLETGRVTPKMWLPGNGSGTRGRRRSVGRPALETVGTAVSPPFSPFVRSHGAGRVSLMNGYDESIHRKMLTCPA